MKKFTLILLAGLMLVMNSCGTYTGNGTLIGTGAGAALGAGVGALIGKGKGAAIGSAVGAAVGAGTGALIGKHMDKKKAADADMINTDILIKGHTDNTGSAAVNEKLSLQRAEAVSKVLKSNGIASARLSEEGCSYNEPVADNSTAAGRKQNRRVEVYVLATQAMVDQYTNDSSL